MSILPYNSTPEDAAHSHMLRIILRTHPYSSIAVVRAKNTVARNFSFLKQNTSATPKPLLPKHHSQRQSHSLSTHTHAPGAMSLPAEKVSQYSAIIDRIIATGDLETISTKQIRNGLQAAVDEDLGEYKIPIKQLILERFDKFHAAPEAAAPAPASATTSTKNSRESCVPSRAASTPISFPDAEEEYADSSPPPKKKLKKQAVDSDAALAAKLQAQENTRSRSTRGGGAKLVKKRAAAPKRKREKSRKKVAEDDDSDVLGTDGEKKEVIRKGGFHKEYLLSAPLAELVGATQLSRPQAVKKIWEHIKAHDLQNPADKRQIRCDDRMQLIFKMDQVHMFTMNKLLGNHLYPLEE